MWEGLIGGIRQMGVFMICAQALIYFKPKGSYEKYLKLLVSAMILVQLLSPMAALLSGKEGQSLEERIGFYSSYLEQGMGEAAFQEYRLEQIRQQLLTTQIRAQMEAWDWQPQQQDGQGTIQDIQEAAGEIRVQIDPVIVGTSQNDGQQDMGQGEDGQQDMGQREDGHGGEDQERDGEVAEEG